MRENINIPDERALRFSGAKWAGEMTKHSALLAGCGGIGSWTSIFLSRLGLENIILVDNDRVSPVNLGGQFFISQDYNSYKVDALGYLINSFSPRQSCTCKSIRFNSSQLSTSVDINICGFDSMASREEFYKSWKQFWENEDTISLFIDGRMAAEEFQILCFTSKDKYYQDLYEKDYLFSDEEAEPTICNYKQTSFMGGMIGSFITNLVVNFISNKVNPDGMRDLPFYTGYSATDFIIDTKS